MLFLLWGKAQSNLKIQGLRVSRLVGKSTGRVHLIFNDLTPDEVKQVKTLAKRHGYLIEECPQNFKQAIGLKLRGSVLKKDSANTFLSVRFDDIFRCCIPQMDSGKCVSSLYLGIRCQCK